MKISIILLLVSVISLFASGQQISRSTISTAGDRIQNAKGISITYTIGEVFSETTEHEFHITGGFQQGTLSKEHLPNKLKEALIEGIDVDLNPTNHIEISQQKVSNSEVEIILYPNPTTSSIWIQSNQEQNCKCFVTIFDLSGKKVLRKKILLKNSQKFELSEVNKLLTGNYFLQIIDNNKNVTTKQFTKI